MPPKEKYNKRARASVETSEVVETEQNKLLVNEGCYLDSTDHDFDLGLDLDEADLSAIETPIKPLARKKSRRDPRLLSIEQCQGEIQAVQWRIQKELLNLVYVDQPTGFEDLFTPALGDAVSPEMALSLAMSIAEPFVKEFSELTVGLNALVASLHTPAVSNQDASTLAEMERLVTEMVVLGEATQRQIQSIFNELCSFKERLPGVDFSEVLCLTQNIVRAAAGEVSVLFTAAEAFMGQLAASVVSGQLPVQSSSTSPISIDVDFDLLAPNSAAKTVKAVGSTIINCTAPGSGTISGTIKRAPQNP